MKKNEIFLLKRNSVLLNTVENGEHLVEDIKVATILKNLEYYGYTLSEELINKLRKSSETVVLDFYKELIEILEDVVGCKATKEPLYKNFPDEVMEKETFQLYLDAIIYYLTSFEVTPVSERQVKYPLLENVELKVIDLGTEEEFMTIFQNLLVSKTSISMYDKEVVEFFIETYKDDIVGYLPEEITFKETLTYITYLCKNLKGAATYFSTKYKTATDVLRLATAMSNGDVSLSENTKFKSFNRKDRVFLLSLLDNCNNLEEDMAAYSEKWKRLGERLHPSEYRQFKAVNSAFYKIRNNVKINTFASSLEKAFKEKDEKLVLKLLSSRPGEFARALDRTLRTFNSEEVLKSLSKVINKVPTPILLQIREHFIRREKSEAKDRVFFPKGVVAKSYVTENKTEKIDEILCKKVLNLCNRALVCAYSEKEPLGKVYIDEELKNYIVPTSLRNSERAIKTLARGSKMSILDNTKTIRLFLFWEQDRNSSWPVDLDLSAVMIDENFNQVENIYYGNLRNSRLNCVHSGDVRTGVGGATEFVDLDLDKLKANGIRYVACSVNAFTGENFSDMPACFVGFMEREDAKFGKIFEPKTVKHKSDLTSNSGINIPIIIDVEEKKVVWTDLASESYLFAAVHNEEEKNRIVSSLKAVIDINKPNLYDVLLLNAIARGQFVTNKDEADVIFSLTEGITPFDTDILLAEYI